MLKLTSKFSVNCTDLLPIKRLAAVFGSVTLACVLLCVLMHNLPVMVMAQEPEPQAPVETTVQDTTAAVAPAEPGRIEIRIEFPIVEPFFDIFYEREEPRIEPDMITPAANPLQKLPPTSEEVTQEKLRAKRLEKPQMLLNLLRE